MKKCHFCNGKGTVVRAKIHNQQKVGRIQPHESFWVQNKFKIVCPKCFGKGHKG